MIRENAFHFQIYSFLLHGELNDTSKDFFKPNPEVIKYSIIFAWLINKTKNCVYFKKIQFGVSKNLKVVLMFERISYLIENGLCCHGKDKKKYLCRGHMISTGTNDFLEQIQFFDTVFKFCTRSK